jgi:hypothetical protein
MAVERDEGPDVGQRASAGSDAYVAGRDIHIHHAPAGDVPLPDRQRLAGLVPGDTIRAAAGVPAAWNVPVRLHTFTGRAGMLEDIERALRPWKTPPGSSASYGPSFVAM